VYTRISLPTCLLQDRCLDLTWWNQTTISFEKLLALELREQRPPVLDNGQPQILQDLSIRQVTETISNCGVYDYLPVRLYNTRRFW